MSGDNVIEFNPSVSGRKITAESAEDAARLRAYTKSIAAWLRRTTDFGELAVSVASPLLSARKRRRQLAGNVHSAPILFLAIARGGYFGMFLILKLQASRRAGRPASPITPEEKDWINAQREKNFYVCVAFGYLHARASVEYYLDGDRTPSGGLYASV